MRSTIVVLFLLAATWWVTEVVPIGVTAILIGVVQALFLIRPAREALHHKIDEAVDHTVRYLQVFEGTGPSDEERRLVLGGNLLRLLRGRRLG